MFSRETQAKAEQEATAALKLERDRAQAYLELNDAILMTLDADRRIRELNTRGGEQLGAPAAEILGRDWLTFMRGEPERERALLLLAGALASGSSREHEFDSMDANGEPRRIIWRCIALRAADGTPAGWLCSGADISDRARREAETHLAQDRITRVARLATLGEMAAGIAHELNQPLTAIATYARACERYIDMPQPDMAELREAVREIGTEGLRAGRIIGRLRQLVRGDDNDDRVLTDVNALIEELSSLLTADARVHDTRLRFALAPDLPRVSANPLQLQQVVLNLVQNAFEALLEVPAGEREVELKTARTLTADVEILVTDNGPGVSPVIAERMFDPFATTRKSGTGLGLAISRTIVLAHGGTIDLLPSHLRGARFQVRLPAREEERA